MISKLYFENFKSFVNAELEIGNITTLIGTNAAGKTNAIEGLMILSELVTGRDISVILDGSKNRGSEIRGGAKGCCRFGSDYFVLGCDVFFDDQITLEYRVKILVKDRIMIGEEKLTEIRTDVKTGGLIDKKTMFQTKEADEQSGNISVSCNNGLKGRNPDISCIRFSTVISQIATKLSQERLYGRTIAGYSNKVISTLTGILFLNPEVPQMRGYSFIGDVTLKVNASNISSVLNKLCTDKDNKEKLLDIMRRLPENEITDIVFMEGSLNDIILSLKEKVGSRIERIDATRLSDGTLRCLAIVAAVLSEHMGGMIVIEEIDNGLHPGRAKALINLVSEVARERQVDVLVTTHNAILLNGLSVEDMEGVVVAYRDKDEGNGKFVKLTDIRRVQEMLAVGRLGDVFSDDIILKYIKDDRKRTTDYSWLEVKN